MTFDTERRVLFAHTITAMKAPRADTLFRCGGLVACVIVALPTLARVMAGDVTQFLQEAGVQDVSRVNVAVARWLLAALEVGVIGLFAGAFWLNTRPAVLDMPRRGAV